MDPDPDVFGPQRSGSGPFHHQAKKENLISTVLWLFYDFLSLKTDYMYLQKVKIKKLYRKNLFFVDILKATDEKSRIWIRNSVWYGPRIRTKTSRIPNTEDDLDWREKKIKTFEPLISATFTHIIRFMNCNIWDACRLKEDSSPPSQQWRRETVCARSHLCLISKKFYYLDWRPLPVLSVYTCFQKVWSIHQISTTSRRECTESWCESQFSILGAEIPTLPARG